MLLDARVRFAEEPNLEFGHQQLFDDPKSGLYVFGPITDSSAPKSLRVGIAGTATGIGIFRKWARRVAGPISAGSAAGRQNISFPGFEAVFGFPSPFDPVVEIVVDHVELARRVRISHPHERVYQSVSLFTDRILEHMEEEPAHVEVWFVIIPDDVFRYGRPNSIIPSSEVEKGEVTFSVRTGLRYLSQEPSLFEDDMKAAKMLLYEVNFHNQLKARLLDKRVVVQLVRESSLLSEDELIESAVRRRRQNDADVAWNLCTTTYYKADGKPWKLANVRDGVCYVGLVFKTERAGAADGMSCCGAQMFLDSGDGLVFGGTKGRWYFPATREYHLNETAAHRLISNVIAAYVKKKGVPPRELFIHGRTFFNAEEWLGFRRAAPVETNVVGIRIRPAMETKAYSPTEMPVLRGTSIVESARRGYLWTKGLVPRLGTYPGRETPNPLVVDIVRGETSIDVVLDDVLALTKLNYNSCSYADGLPVTLRFADAVGEILVAAPIADLPPLPFKHYI